MRAARVALLALGLCLASASPLVEEHEQPSLGSAGSPGEKLNGFFVMPCSAGYPVEGMKVSSFQTRYYDANDQSYEIDTTYYLNDENCTPKDSDIFIKYYFKGQVEYEGKNKVVKDAWRANLTWSGGNYYFADTQPGRYTVDLLNKECPCGGEWKTGEFRKVESSACKPAEKDETHLCQIITGKSDLFNYRWLDDKRYVTSVDCFSSDFECWNNPINEDYVRNRIPESGNNNPDSCDYELWAKCGAGIETAQRNCDTCVGLECDGCLFREIVPDWDPATSKDEDYSDWYDCCPCLYRYAEEYDRAWLKTHC